MMRGTPLVGRCERHAGEAFAPRCDDCAATGADDYAAAQAQSASRDALLAAQEIAAGRFRVGLAHIGLATDALDAARTATRQAAGTTR